MNQYMQGMNTEDNNTGSLSSLKEFSLKGAGYAYLVGDAALFASGMMSGRRKEAMSGLVYTIGGLVCAKYGKEDAERKLQTLNGRLRDHFKEEGIVIPEGSALTSAALAKEGGVIDRIEDFMYANPSQILNSVYAVGGFALMRSGMQHSKHWDTASGALVAAGGLAGLLIPEKHVDPANPPTTSLGKAWAWVQEKPLRAAGYLYMGNNVTLTASALKERAADPAQKSYLFKLLTAGSYVVANSLLSISSKDSTEHNTDIEKQAMMQKLEQTAARVIAAQPKELQNIVLQHTAGYLAAQPEIKMSAAQLSHELEAAVKQLASVPQLPANGPWQQRVQPVDSPQLPHR